MDQLKIKQIVNEINKTKERNIIIVDYGNVQKWEESLHWKIGIKELGNLVKYFSQGNKLLRKFYYGSDFGQKESSNIITMWSAMVLNKARMNNFKVITKKVKYIHDKNYKTGFIKKCNFDVEMSVDLLREADNYRTIILFSGDGDMAYILEYLKSKFKKDIIVFGVRGHIGRELYDARINGVIREILYVEDFEYRLNMNRFS